MAEMLALNGGRPVRKSMLRYATQSVDEADRRAVDEVLRSDWLTTEPAVSAFEGALCDYTRARHAVVVNTGTAALHAAASLGDRALLLAYNRFWVRSDLLQAADTRDEHVFLARSTKDFWAQCQARNFRFILFDDILFKASSRIFETVPDARFCVSSIARMSLLPGRSFTKKSERIGPGQHRGEELTEWSERLAKAA